MKNLYNIFIIFTISIVCSTAFAQKPAFVRKQRQPEFFVPDKEINKKEHLPPVQFKTALPPPVEKVVGNNEKGVRKDKMFIYDDSELDTEEYKYYANDDKVSPYKKAFDEYINDLKYMKKYNQMPVNPQKEKDLGKMNSDAVFKVW